MENKTLIFSIALNGYEKTWKHCLDSQKAYANKFNYNYHLINDVDSEMSAKEAAWLKIPLIIAALQKGFDWVVFLDADCFVNPATPAINLVEQPQKDLYVCHGYSGRINSGVLIIKNSHYAENLFKKIFSKCNWPVFNKKYRAPYENGHVIRHASTYKRACLLDSRWNNCQSHFSQDFIRHYTGPMRQYYKEEVILPPKPIFLPSEIFLMALGDVFFKNIERKLLKICAEYGKKHSEFSITSLI